ncbi:MAG: hypothetical protein EKK69_09330 [Candidatus Competibacteraceae bacterium]|nr:MAG: hypothetical protein EKK69_09330 [Candidatus Competibacteraceae bacterium]
MYNERLQYWIKQIKYPSMINFFTTRKVSLIFSLLFYSLILLLIYFNMLHNSFYAIEDSYITYRYAQNLRLGIGLVFNDGERHFGSTAMGMAVILAAFSWLTESISDIWNNSPQLPGSQIVFIAHLITTLSIGSIAILAYWIALRHLNFVLATSISVFFAILFFSAEYMNDACGHETYLFISFLIFSGYLLIYKDRAFWAGILLGIASTFRPDAFLYMAILTGWLSFLWIHKGYDIQQRQRLFIFLTGYFLIAIPWFLFCKAYFGSILPSTLTAKRAQPLLGHWSNFTIHKALSELVRLMRFPMAFAVAILLSCALLAHVMQERKRVIIGLIYNPLTALMACLLVFGFGQVIFYSLIQISFWFWYIIPLCIIVSLCAFLATVDLLSESHKNKKALVAMTLIAVISLILINRGALYYDLKQLVTSHNINMHITSHDPIVNYLLEHEPAGTSVATSEPGALGFKLGPRYKVIDELGLVSPGVAENIMQGNLDFPFNTFFPQYVIVSWDGKYSPHERPWFFTSYEFVGEFSHPYWNLNLKRGAYLYKRKS